MHVEPVTASLPEGTLPDNETLFGPVGSSLVTVMVADFAPKLAGEADGHASPRFRARSESDTS